MGNLLLAKSNFRKNKQPYAKVSYRDHESKSFDSRYQHKSVEKQSLKGRQQRSPEPRRERRDEPRKDRRDISNLQCFRCDRLGHFAQNCPDRRRRRYRELNKVETEEDDEEEEDEEEEALYMHESVLLNEENLLPKKYESETNNNGVWYLDNGASNHMTGVSEYFSELNQSIKGKVRFGDGSCVAIEGKGSILFQGKTGEQRLLSDIYYIPGLKSNILSLGQATENGCDIRMKADLLTLRDPNGRLLAKVTRTPNRLYKIKLEVGKPTCLHLKIAEDAWCWHARLGHISFKTLEAMSSKQMVEGLPRIKREKQLYDSCLVGKQTRKAFPMASQFRAKRVL